MNFKIQFRNLSLIGSLTLLSLADANESLTTQKTYFDKETGLYFVSGEINFNIKHLGKKEHIEKIYYSLGSDDFRPYEGAIKISKEGQHLLRFKAEDPVKNWSPVENFKIFVDNTAPEIKHYFEGAQYKTSNDWYISPKTALIVNPIDNLSGVKESYFRLDNEKENPKRHGINGPLQFTKEGIYQIFLSAVDQVGNQSKEEPLRFTVDGSAPKVTHHISGVGHQRDQQVYLQKGSFVTLMAEDSLSGVKYIEYNLANQGIKIYQGKLSLSLPVNDLKYRALDHAGNYSAWHNITLHLDTTAPKIFAELKGEYQSLAGKIYAKKGLTLSVGISDKESGTSKIRIEKEEFTGSSKKLEFNNVGEYPLLIQGFDQVGNASKAVSYHLVIEDTPPVVTYQTRSPLKESNGVFYSGIPNELQLNASDSGVGVRNIEFKFNEGEIQRFSSAIDLATLSAGKNTLYYRATDKLGQSSNWQKIELDILASGPKLGLYVETIPGKEVPVSQLVPAEKVVPEAPPAEPKRSVASEKKNKIDSKTKKKKKKKP